METKPESSQDKEEENSLAAWISRKRIVVSLVGFTTLIVYNLCFAKTVAVDPLDYRKLPAVLGTGLVLLGLFIRSWSAGMLYKTHVLVTSGPYSLVRNPLYVGSFLMMLGFCFLMRDWLAAGFIVGPIGLIYWFQVKLEEERLAKKFPEMWPAYAAKTARFFPCSFDRSVFSSWSLKQWIKNREYQALLASLAGLIGLHFYYRA